MVNVEVAQISDLKNIIELIKQINNKELEYLRYNKDHFEFVKRIGNNILNGTVILFLSNKLLIGFLEYGIRSDNTLWIYSLYIKKEYRKYTFNEVTPVFVKLKKRYQTDIYFSVEPTNRAMKMVAHLIRASKVRTYDDGRIEYVVKEKV